MSHDLEKIADALHKAYGERDASRERVKVLEEALTPSAETKIAYAGEDEAAFWTTEFDEDGHEYRKREIVPWICIKSIMAMIRKHADRKSSKVSEATHDS